MADEVLLLRNLPERWQRLDATGVPLLSDAEKEFWFGHWAPVERKRPQLASKPSSDAVTILPYPLPMPAVAEPERIIQWAETTKPPSDAGVPDSLPGLVPNWASAHRLGEAGEQFEIEQPDGTWFEVEQQEDEFGLFWLKTVGRTNVAPGWPAVLNKTTGYWVYGAWSMPTCMEPCPWVLGPSVDVLWEQWRASMMLVDLGTMGKPRQFRIGIDSPPASAPPASPPAKEGPAAIGASPTSPGDVHIVAGSPLEAAAAGQPLAPVSSRRVFAVAAGAVGLLGAAAWLTRLARR